VIADSNALRSPEDASRERVQICSGNTSWPRCCCNRTFAATKRATRKTENDSGRGAFAATSLHRYRSTSTHNSKTLSASFMVPDRPSWAVVDRQVARQSGSPRSAGRRVRGRTQLRLLRSLSQIHARAGPSRAVLFGALDPRREVPDDPFAQAHEGVRPAVVEDDPRDVSHDSPHRRTERANGRTSFGAARETIIAQATKRVTRSREARNMAKRFPKTRPCVFRVHNHVRRRSDEQLVRAGDSLRSSRLQSDARYSQRKKTSVERMHLDVNRHLRTNRPRPDAISTRLTFRPLAKPSAPSPLPATA